MRKKAFLLTMVFLLATSLASLNASDWRIVKKFIKTGVEITAETGDIMILHHPKIDKQIVMFKGGKPEPSKNVDVYSKEVRKRNSNPYVIWIVTPKLYNDPERPKKVWAKFLRAEFLKNLRLAKE